MRAKPISAPSLPRIATLLPSLSFAGPTTQPTPPAPAPSAFTIHDIDDPTGPGILNLKTVQALTMPRELHDWNQQQLQRLKDNGADVIFDHGHSGFFILGWGISPAGINVHLPWGGRSYSFNQVTSLETIPGPMRSASLRHDGPWYDVRFLMSRRQ